MPQNQTLALQCLRKVSLINVFEDLLWEFGGGNVNILPWALPYITFYLPLFYFYFYFLFLFLDCP